MIAEITLSKIIKTACYFFGSMFFAIAGTALAVGDAAAGKEKSAMCQGCHGEDGMSAAPSFPRLAGQYAGYI